MIPRPKIRGPSAAPSRNRLRRACCRGRRAAPHPAGGCTTENPGQRRAMPSATSGAMVRSRSMIRWRPAAVSRIGVVGPQEHDPFLADVRQVERPGRLELLPERLRERPEPGGTTAGALPAAAGQSPGEALTAARLFRPGRPAAGAAEDSERFAQARCPRCRRPPGRFPPPLCALAAATWTSRPTRTAGAPLNNRAITPSRPPNIRRHPRRSHRTRGGL